MVKPDRRMPMMMITSTQSQPHGVKLQLSYYFSVHAGSFRVSVIHQTLTRTTGLTCVCDHSCACVYTRELGTLTASQHNIFDSEKLTNLIVLLTGFEISSFGS